MTNDELKTAAERRRKWQSPQNNHPHKSPYFNCDGDDPNAIYRDMKMLADAYLSRLAADAQQAKEDAEPITGHVIASLMPKEQFGEALYTNASFVLSSGGRISIGGVVGDAVGFSVAIHGKPTITTRGQLRKLLEALKGST